MSVAMGLQVPITCIRAVVNPANDASFQLDWSIAHKFRGHNAFIAQPERFVGEPS